MNADAIAESMTVIRTRLTDLLLNAAETPADAIERLFAELYGRAWTAEERRLFVLHVGPIARRTWLAVKKPTDAVPGTTLTVGELRIFLSWFSAYATSVTELDLRYFGGLSVKETAAALNVSRDEVLNSLRTLKRVLNVQLLESPPELHRKKRWLDFLLRR